MSYQNTVMVYNKVIAPNKVIFSHFDFSYENQIFFEKSCFFNDAQQCNVSLKIHEFTKII